MVSHYKVEHFFGKLKKCFKCLIIINDKTLKIIMVLLI